MAHRPAACPSTKERSCPSACTGSFPPPATAATSWGSAPPPRRDADLDYLSQVARVAEQVGFDAVLTPTGTFCEDAWLTTAALIRETKRLRFLVAFRPGLISPTLAAQQAATFQRLSGGRLLLNIVTGGSAEEQRRFGDHLDHDLRYDRCDEFLTVLRGAWEGRPFDFDGEHYQVDRPWSASRPTPVRRSSSAGPPTRARRSPPATPTCG